MEWRRKKALRIADQISPEQLDILLDRLDFEGLCTDRTHSSRRDHPRRSYRALGIAVQISDEQTDITLIAATRNLSAGGLSFVGGQVLDPGTACIVRLLDLEGQPRQIGATVVYCRQIDKVYEVGLQFEQGVCPAQFVPSR